MGPDEIRKIRKRIEKCHRRIENGKDVKREQERLTRLSRILKDNQ